MKAPLCIAAFVAGSLLCGSARGQSFFLASGVVRSGGVTVGVMSRLPVTITWHGTTLARAVYVGDTITVTGDLDLHEARTELAAGVGAAVVLGDTGPWHIEMLPATWAPVLGHDDRGTRIALPPDLPVDGVEIPAGSRGTATLPSPEDPWTPTSPDSGAPVQRLLVAPTPSAATTWELQDGAFVRDLGGIGGRRSVVIEYRGYRIRGYTLPDRAALYGDPIGHLAGRGSGGRWGAGLPAGTQLFARPGAGALYTVLRRGVPETLEGTLAESCPGIGAATFEGAVPAGWSERLVDISDPSRGSELLIDAWVHLPALVDTSDFDPGPYPCPLAPIDGWPRAGKTAK